MDPNPERSLENQLNDLRIRVYSLEETVRGFLAAEQRSHSAAGPATVSTPDEGSPSANPPAGPEGIANTRPTIPSIPAFEPAQSYKSIGKASDRSLESRIGSQWFNRIGILAVLIGMSWFLKFAIDNNWIGPLGRILIGLVAGAAFIVWSERFQRKGYPAFGYSLKAVGSGILYLSLWAAFALFHLIPATVAFAAMILVTAFNGFLAWKQDSELLALYSIVGGFSTPLLLSTGENHEVALFSYLLLMNVAVLVLLVLKPWSRLLFGAFVGTVMLFTGWWFDYYSVAQLTTTSVFLACFFLIFAFAPRLVNAETKNLVVLSAWDNLALVVMPILNAALVFLAAYAMADAAGADWVKPWLAVAFAAFYLGLLRLPSRGILREGAGILSNLQLTLAVVFLSLAIPLKTHGRWLTIGWLVQGAALLWVSRRARSLLLRVLALLSLGLGLAALITINPDAATTPLLNQRFATYLVAIAIFVFAGWVLRSAPHDAKNRTEPPVAAACVLIVNALVLLAISWEIHNYWWSLRWRGNWNQFHDYRIYAQFTYSALLMLYGAILLGVGFWRRSAFLRWQALLLVAVSIGKVFLVDVSALSQGFRILSFLGLGALLLAVSFVYQRDWLHLRTADAVATPDHEATPGQP